MVKYNYYGDLVNIINIVYSIILSRLGKSELSQIWLLLTHCHTVSTLITVRRSLDLEYRSNSYIYSGLIYD